eukprot:scaffold3289_cov54-Cylindrotheca_fusiformis.AAC.1
MVDDPCLTTRVARLWDQQNKDPRGVLSVLSCNLLSAKDRRPNVFKLHYEILSIWHVRHVPRTLPHHHGLLERRLEIQLKTKTSFAKKWTRSCHTKRGIQH